MESLSSIKTNIDTIDGLIKANYTNVKTFLAILKESVASTVQTQLEGIKTEVVVNDTVELDEAWWAEHAAELGWVKDGAYYVYTDPKTGEKYAYSPKGHNMYYMDAKGHKSSCDCRLYLNGDLSDVTETVTLLKAYKGNKVNPGSESTRPQLIIAPPLTGDEGDKKLTADRALMCSKLGDKLLESSGNTNTVTHNLCGFSMGGQQAMRMVSGDLGSKYVGYYDKVTLVNISPGNAIKYTPEQIKNMSGMEFDIITTYNNNLGQKTRDGLLDFSTKQQGGPHLDKLSSIPGAKVNLYLPDASKDTKGSVTKTIAYAKGLGRDNVTIIQFEVPEGDLDKYLGGKSTHGSGPTELIPLYLSGIEPLE